MPSTDTLLAPYRPIRRIEAGADAPFPATLCRLASGDTALLVDAAELPVQWQGWTAQPDGHLLQPVDLVRRADGHDVVLPVLTTRLVDLAQRRRSEGRDLLDGEAVTLAVSLLRGLEEVRTGWPDERGEWWLTDAGFPALVTGCGSIDAADATRAALEEVAEGRPATPWHDVLEAARRPRIAARELARLEDDLFAFASARAVDMTARPSAAGEGAGRERWRDDIEPAAPRTLWEQLGRHVDADLADVFSRATTAVWRRLRSRPGGGSRRRVWLLAAAVAAVVVLGGLLWPQDRSPEASAPETVSAQPTITPASTDAPAPAVSEGGDGDTTTEPSAQGAPAAGPPDLVAVASDLLTARSACDQPSCAGAVMVDPSRTLAPGVVDLPSSARTVTLLDEFGGVAVLRVDAVDGTAESELVVIELVGDRWLLRDVTLAQQP